MTAGWLIFRSLAYFRAAHAALLAGMILVTAVLTGALILGDSVRGSLSDLTARRRGGYETVVTANGFFSDTLAERITALSAGDCDGGLALMGRVRSERTALSAGAQVVAIPNAANVPRHGAWITRTLAQTLGIARGDILLITLPGVADARDAVLGHRDRTSLTSARVTVERILDERSKVQPEMLLAWFDLHPSQRPPANAWLNLADLQEALLADVPVANRIPASPANILLVRSKTAPVAADRRFPPPQAMTLEDYGLGVSRVEDHLILHSGGIYISPKIAKAIQPFEKNGLAVHALLLDHVVTENPGIPPLNYVLAAGIEGRDDLALKPGEAAVNQWTADQLHLKAGDSIHVAPYRLQSDGSVAVAERMTVKISRIISMVGLGADPTLTPAFHGLTDTDTVANWNPPAGFPFDRLRVTPADEAYWRDHKAAPKVLFSLATAQRLVKPSLLVTTAMDSAGELTSVRVPAADAGDFSRDLLRALTPPDAGFVARPFVPGQPPSTDFAGLFLGLSGFLLIAALLLVVLLFRLAVEQRVRQMGLLGALGFVPTRIARLIFAECALIGTAGAVAGLPLAVLYTRLLVASLGTWWVGATGTQAIEVHINVRTLAVGAAASLAAALIALAIAARSITRGMPMAQMRGLNAAQLSADLPNGRDNGMKCVPVTILAIGLALALAPVVLSWAGYLAASIAFLLSGFLLLALSIVILARLPSASRRVRHTLWDVASAGILRQRTRAILCVALMAAATFLLTSVTAFQSVSTAPTRPPSPTGGYQLMLSTRNPLPADLQTPAGRRLLGVPEHPLFAETCFTSLLVQAGDDISCLNMMQPTSATLVGVPADVVDRLAVSSQSPPPPEMHAIPAAVDRQTAQYILHAGLGQRVPQSATARPVVISRLLDDSIFQSYALVPIDDFRQAFPEVTRSSLILVDCPPSAAPELQALLQRSLDDYGVTVESTSQRLASYHAVADSYIAAFQFLGALALMIGALGLVVVLARNVIQRRAELALLQALGFTRGRVAAMLVIEHGMLLLMGMSLGLITALLATLPQIQRIQVLPAAAAAGIILLLGLLVLTAAAHLAMRTLTPAVLRQE